MSNGDAREMDFCSLDGGENGEHNGVGFVEISQIFAMKDVFFFETDASNRFRGCCFSSVQFVMEAQP